MPHPISIITDSTSDIPAEWRQQYDITVIPLTIVFGEQTYLDGVDLPDGGDTPQETAERSETRNAVRAALYRLTDEHREVLLLRYMQELDYGEIARALHISEGTVKSRINRAKARLKELLSGGNLSTAASVKPTGKEGQQ